MMGKKSRMDGKEERVYLSNRLRRKILERYYDNKISEFQNTLKTTANNAFKVNISEHPDFRYI